MSPRFLGYVVFGCLLATVGAVAAAPSQVERPFEAGDVWVWSMRGAYTSPGASDTGTMTTTVTKTLIDGRSALAKQERYELRSADGVRVEWEASVYYSVVGTPRSELARNMGPASVGKTLRVTADRSPSVAWRTGTVTSGQTSYADSGVRTWRVSVGEPERVVTRAGAFDCLHATRTQTYRGIVTTVDGSFCPAIGHWVKYSLKQSQGASDAVSWWELIRSTVKPN